MPFKDPKKMRAAQRAWYARNRESVREKQMKYKHTAAGMVAVIRSNAKARKG